MTGHFSVAGPLARRILRRNLHEYSHKRYIYHTLSLVAPHARLWDSVTCASQPPCCVYPSARNLCACISPVFDFVIVVFVIVIINDANGHNSAGRSDVLFAGGHDRRGGARPPGARTCTRSLCRLPRKCFAATGVCAHCDTPARPPRAPAHSGARSPCADQCPPPGRRRGHSDRRVNDPRSRPPAVSGARAARHADPRTGPAPESRRSCPPAATGSPRVQLIRSTVHRHRHSRAAAIRRPRLESPEGGSLSRDLSH